MWPYEVAKSIYYVNIYWPLRYVVAKSTSPLLPLKVRFNKLVDWSALQIKYFSSFKYRRKKIFSSFKYQLFSSSNRIFSSFKYLSNIKYFLLQIQKEENIQKYDQSQRISCISGAKEKCITKGYLFLTKGIGHLNKRSMNEESFYICYVIYILYFLS